MQINVNTDNTIDRHQGLDEHVASVVRAAIGRFGEQVTRVDVHLSNAQREKKADGGNGCLMEARITGYAPVVVREHNLNLHQAIQQAGNKLERAIDNALGRLQDKARTPASVPPVASGTDTEAD